MVAMLDVGKERAFFISLFGEFNAIIAMPTSRELPIVFAPEDGVVVEVNPETREFSKTTLGKLMRRIRSDIEPDAGATKPNMPGGAGES